MVVELFMGICLMASHQCLPEIVMPISFGSVELCGAYVQSEADAAGNPARPAMLHDLAFTFRCAGRA